MNSDNLLNEGLDYFKSGELRKAEITLRRFLKVCPNHFDAMHFLGIILFECGRPKESIELIQRAIRSDSHSPQPYYNLGKIFKSLNMAEEAIENFKKAISIKPNYFQALNMLGNVVFKFTAEPKFPPTYSFPSLGPILPDSKPLNLTLGI